MGCPDRHLEAITRLQHESRLAFNRKFQVAIKNKTGFDPWMGMPGNGRSRLLVASTTIVV